MSRHTDLAEAVKDALNAGTFTVEFTAARLPMVRFDLKDMGTLHVSVVPGPRSQELFAQDTDRIRCDVDVAVQQKPADITNTSIDPLYNLQEEIEAAIFTDGVRLELETDAGVNWVCVGMRTLEGAENGAAIEHMQSLRTFTGISRFTFQRL